MRHIPALPFDELKLTSTKLKNRKYPKEAKTLGEHLSRRRLDLGLRQRDVASQIGVTKGTIMLWEKNLVEPHLSQLPKVTQFIGPGAEPPAQTLGEKLRAIRRRHGLSLDLMARYLNVDPGSLERWKRGASIQHFMYR